MSRAGGYKPREPASLKEAQAALVAACGGLDAAAGLSRVRRSQMARYTDPADDDTNMPADVVAALQLHCGQPIVSRFLDLAVGFVAVPVPKAESHDSLMKYLATIGKEQGELFKHACEALADGSLTRSEKAKVRGETMKAITALTAFLGAIEGAEDRRG